MKAVGRASVPMPPEQPRITEYVLEGRFWCRLCRRVRHPAPAVDGGRWYACGPKCPQPPTEALPVEQHALLAAFVRAAVVLRGVGRPSGLITFVGPEPEHWHNADVQVSAEELHRWQQCRMSDRRAVLAVAYTRVELDEQGQICLMWRHRCT